MTPARRHRGVTRVATSAVLLAILGTSCGVPDDDEVRALPTSSVPYGLLAERRSTVTTPSTGTTHGRIAAHVAFVVGDAGVRLVERTVLAGAPKEVTQALLDQVQAGPTDAERRRGLDSTLPATGGLRVAGIAGSVITVELSGDLPRQAPDRLPITVAQLVFTLTSVPGVDAVTLRRSGQPVDAPLPDGSLTSGPLTPRDYGQLLNRAPDPR
jgi:spore germination protein GerM